MAITPLVAGVEVALGESPPCPLRPVLATLLAGVLEAGTEPGNDLVEATAPPNRGVDAAVGERVVPLGGIPTSPPAQADIVQPSSWFGSEPFLALRELFHPVQAQDGGLVTTLSRWLLSPAFVCTALVLGALTVWRWRTVRHHPLIRELPEVNGPS
jgi:hypothetical protein